MRKALIRTALIFSLIVIGAVTVLLTTNRALLDDYALESARGLLRERGIGFSAKRLHLTLSGVQGEGVGLILPVRPAFISIVTDQITISPSLLSVLRLAPRIDFNAKLYGGSVSGRVTSSMQGDLKKSELAVENLDLSRQPQISGFGFTSGLLSVNLSGLEFSAGAVQRGAATLTVADLAKPAVTTYRIPVRGSADSLPVSIPALRDGRVHLSAKRLESGWNIETLDFTSSLGSLGGSGFVHMTPDNSISQVDISMTLQLAAEAKQYQPLLSLACVGPLSSQSEMIKLKINGLPPRVTCRVVS